MTHGAHLAGVKSAAITALKTLSFLVGLVFFLLLLAVGTEAGSRWTINRVLGISSDNIPFRFAIESMNGTLMDELSFTNFSVTADEAGGLSATMGILQLTWNPLALFNDSLHIKNLQIRQIVIDPGQASSVTEEEGGGLEEALQSVFTLPFSVQLDQAELGNITLRNSAVNGNAGSGVNQRLARIALSGNLEQQGLEIMATIDQDDANGLTASLNLTPSQYELSGSLNWHALLAGKTANGNLTVNGTLEELAVEHVFNQPAVVSSSGQITTGLFDGSTPAIDLRHDFSDISGADLPLPALAQLLNLDGSVTTRGTPEQINVLGELEAQLQNFGMLIAEVDVTYQPSGIQINRLGLDSEKLTLAVSGNYDLVVDNSPASSLSLSWVLENFTDAELFQNLELVSLEGNGSVNVEITGEQVITALAIEELAGDINSFPLSGFGELVLSNDQLEQININVAAGGNALALNGSLSPELNLGWQLQAPILNRILFTLEGAVSGEGRLEGTRERPRLNGVLNGSQVSYQDESIQLQLGLVDAVARYDGTDNLIELHFSDLEVGEGDGVLSFPQGDLMVSGTLPEHEFSVATRSSLFALQARASGAYQDEIWNAVIPALDVQSDYGDWQLEQPVEIIASSTQASFSEHCWTTTSYSLCGEANWDSETGVAGDVVIDNFPLSYINNKQLIESAGLENISAVMMTRPQGFERLLADYDISLPANGFVDGRTDVDVSFSELGGDWAGTELNFRLSPRDLLLGVVIPASEDSASQEPRVESYGLDEVQLDVLRENGEWSLESAFQIYVPETDGLDFQGAFSGQVTLNDAEDLTGQFDLDFSNIAWLEALVPNLLNPAGELKANGQIAGNLSRPLLVFASSLSNASFELPEYGLLLQDIDLALHSEQENQITITGNASSGDGQVSINSLLTTPFIDSRSMQLDVNGENFQIINSPGTQVKVNPNLVINYKDNILDITGSLEMPQFDLDISNNRALVGNGSISVSRDVVVFNIPPELEGTVEANNDGLLGRIPVTGNVMLGLGDQVRFRGFGLDLNLTGDLRLEQSIDRPLLAYGELAIPMGNYSMYGQGLLIENGRLLFLGNPLNPAVDLRALRNTNNAQVGLQMSGTINRLQAQLFSTPALPESEILSLLLTGRSFQNIGNQDGDNMLGAIANLGLEKGQGLTNVVRNGLGLDTVDISTSDDYRESALGLGKFIRPNLFMRYDIGLFDRENSLTLEYILTERLKMEVETGVSQSVDLTYTVEK